MLPLEIRTLFEECLMGLLGGDVIEPVAPLDAELGIDVIRVGRVHDETQDGCNQETSHPWKQDLCPIDAVVLQGRHRC